MKAFSQLTRDYIRHEISYENLMYLISVLPPYRGYEESVKKKNGIVNNNKPARKNIKHWDQFNF